MRISIFLLLVLLTFATAIPSLAQDNNGLPDHPIDVKLDNCLDSNPSTARMVECLGVAYKEWDDELNKNYKLLQSVVNAEQKSALRLAQLSWITYRDKEIDLLQALYKTKEGTMFVPMYEYSRVELVKKRALELKSHYNLMAEF